MGNLSAMFDNLTAQATTINLNLKYADNSDVINSFDGKLHASVQCLPDLSAVNCVTCLKTAFSGIRNLSLSIAKVPRGVRILLPSCNLRYELYPFLYASVPPSTRQGNEDEGMSSLH
uniref:ATP binding protein n=1 Tax=Solanum tuberosum TaxID=4113 RepID=M1B7Z2_SOLTU